MRFLIAVAVFSAVFLIIGLPSGVVTMIDSDYCFTHHSRPDTVLYHEEALSWFPPGPECRLTLENGSSRILSPGWWPTIAVTVSLLAAIGTLRVRAVN
jgi:hypothetical protein